MRRVIVIFALALAPLAVGGCGSSNGGSSTPSVPAASAPAASTSTGTEKHVSMKNIQFTPSTVSVKKGTTVVWTNDDSVNHDVTKTSGPGPNFTSGTGSIGSGSTYQVTFKSAGTVKYHCTVHPGMTGTIVVK